jgi:hypothetical protein
VAGSTPLRLGIFLGVAVAACLPMLDQAGAMNSFHDAQFLSGYERDAVLSVSRFHQLPLWDPFTCGGIYGLGAPQTRYASPFFLLSLLFGTDRAASLLAVLLPVLGMEGMYQYARHRGALSVPSLLVAPFFPLCGWFALAWRFGWVQFLSFCLVPWILVGLRGVLRGSRRGALLCSAAIAITMGFGGTYTLPMAVLLCACELLSAALPRLSNLRGRGARVYAALTWRRVQTIAFGMAFTIPLVLGIAAYRLWPMLNGLSATLRIMGGEPRNTLQGLWDFLFVGATQSSQGLGHFYLAPGVAALALLAAPWRGNAGAWLGAALSYALSLGHVSEYAPFVLLRKLPLYDTLRYPERYLLLFVLAVSLLAASGASTLIAITRCRLGRKGPSIVLGLLGALVLHGLVLEADNMRALASRVHLVPTPDFQDAPFRQSRGNRWLVSHFVAEGMGSLGCGEAYPVPMSTRLRGDLPAEEYLASLHEGAAAVGSAKRVSWSPNHMVVAVDTPTPVRLAINQNHHPGWRSNVGRVEPWDGLLSVVLPAGRHQVALDFWPRSGIGGLLASLVAAAGGVLFALVGLRSRLLQILAVCAGPLVVLATMAVWSEAAFQRPAPRTESGEPVFLPAVPAGARPLHVQFDVPLVLEAALVPTAPLTPGAGEASIELFFRRTGPLSPSLGIFVHGFGPSGRDVNGDHPELSGQVYLARMPPNQIARDAFRLPLPLSATGERELRVGLWNAFGDGARRNVIDAGRATIKDNAVVIGTLQISGGP